LNKNVLDFATLAQFKDAKGDWILYSLVMHDQSEEHIVKDGWYVDKKHLSIGWHFTG
jgi:hypothetical protein